MTMDGERAPPGQRQRPLYRISGWRPRRLGRRLRRCHTGALDAGAEVAVMFAGAVVGVVGCQLSVVSCQLSVVGCQLSVVSCQRLTSRPDNRQPTTVNRQPTTNPVTAKSLPVLTQLLHEHVPDAAARRIEIECAANGYRLVGTSGLANA